MTYQNIAFTICSNNYLGQALALKKSFLAHNPGFGFYIILVDKMIDEVDYSLFEPAQIVPIADIPALHLEDLFDRYYIIELNTSVKPSAIKHLLKENKNAKTIYYLDPDLYFYQSLEETNTLLQEKSMVLTPHILSPIPRDGMLPEENTFFRFGIYNLGFLGLNAQHPETHKMLDWWEERNLKFGYDRPQKGYFVDQLWMELAPLFFKDVHILRSYNYNMGPWNLHEREVVSVDGNTIVLNDSSTLVFYHYSKIAAEDEKVSREYDRYVLTDFPLLQALYRDYKTVLEECNFYEMKKLGISYPVKMSLKPAVKKRSMLSRGLMKLGRIFMKLSKKV